MNPNWIRTTIASFLLAILLRVGLGVPFLSTFVALGIIFITHVVMTEMGTGVMTLWEWIKSLQNVAMGIVIFIALRFLAAKLLGLYPADNYNTLDDSGGLYWILVGHDVSARILWEVMFAFVAGQITVMWVRGTHRLPVRAIFVISLIVLTFQISTPNYTKTWANNDEVSTNLVDHGVIGASVKGLWVLAFGKPNPAPSPPPASSTYYAPTAPPVEALVLEHECLTPCSANIAWPFQIRVGGSYALRIKFNGSNWVDYPAGEGDLKAPSQMRSGETKFESPNKEHPNVRVQVYRRTTVQGGR